jgi:hypothetical protein
MILTLAGGDITKYDEIKSRYDVCDYVMQQCYKKYENYCEQVFIKRTKSNK